MSCETELGWVVKIAVEDGSRDVDARSSTLLVGNEVAVGPKRGNLRCQEASLAL